VWQVLSNFSAYPDWNPFILAVHGNVHTGAKVKYRFQFPPCIRVWTGANVFAFTPRKELRWAAHFLTPSLFSGDHHFIIEPLSESSVLFHHGEVFTGLLVPASLPLLKMYGQRVYEGLNIALKRRAEALL
jgi:hypothetical protein